VYDYEAKFGETPSIQWLYDSCKGDLAKYIAMVQKAVKTGISLGEFEGTPGVLT
jgi:hypothetical protein